MNRNPQSGALLGELGSRLEGLSAREAESRLSQFGRNVIEEQKKTPLLRRVWEQVSDPMVLVLLAAAVVSGFLGELTDMAIILVVVVANSVLGIAQENKAEKAIAALKKLSAQQAHVIRDGKEAAVQAEALVPGDIVSLQAGDLVPADLTLLETSSMKIGEAALTGESVPTEKNAAAEVPDDASLADRHNMAYCGTGVTYGRGLGVVTATGMKTEMGRIARMINVPDESKTPLQRKLAEIGKVLTVLVAAVCAVIFVTCVLKNGGFTFKNVLDSFMIAVSLAVAAIPEGLPAVVTIVMALGVTRMAKRRAIIKKLPAVETLGCAEIICSDKTGTLTLNKMDVREIYMSGRLLPGAEFLEGAQGDRFAEILYLCNDSSVEGGEEIGDPTETALKRFVLGRYKAERFASLRRLQDLPFDSDRKMMSTVNELPDGKYVFTKGAPDELLRRCSRIMENGEIRPITGHDREAVLGANRAMAEKALRVLAGAFRPFGESEQNRPLEEDLVFVGLAGMMDPPRPEAFEAIEKCRRAGITPIMITGDHRDTAVAVARELGIITDPSQAVFGNELDGLSDEELDARLDRIRVYARVSPEHKVRIVEAWKRRGKVVAMTGDGVNDAPALRIADIGVGMGVTGTDVAKGVSDMLLADDNFATIVNAVEEGRKIYTNIRKTVQFLLASNISEVLSLFIATLLLPSHIRFLGPVQILWINLVTDSVPAVGLGLERADRGIMNERPRRTDQSFFANGLGRRILYQGVIMTALTLASYYLGEWLGGFSAGTTTAFITLSTVQLFYSFCMKSPDSVFSRRTFDNPVLLAGLLVPTALMLLIVCIPPVGALFNTVPLTFVEWLAALGLAFAIVPVTELIKLLRRLRKKSGKAAV